LGEEERREEEKAEEITLTITLPTKEKIIKTIKELFPGIEVKVQEGKPEEERHETSS